MPLNSDEAEQSILDLSDRIVALSRDIATLSDILNQKLAETEKRAIALESRVATEEALNVAQQTKIEAFKKALGVSVGLMAISFLISSGVINSPENRDLLERVAVGCICSSLVGAIGAQAVKQ